MSKKGLLVLGLVGLLILALWGLSIVASPNSDTVDPENTGFVGGIERTLGALPGVGTTLDPDAVRTRPDCFDGSAFVLDGDIRNCRLDVPADVDRLTLGDIGPGCFVGVAGQNGAIDHTVDRSDANEDGEVRISLTGDGARLDFSAFPLDTTCRFTLVN